MKTDLFPLRMLVCWLTAAALVFACSFYFMTRDNSRFDEPDITGPSTNSKSAIGYAAVYRMLEKLGIAVAQSQGHGSEPVVIDDVLVIAEPTADKAVLRKVKNWIDKSPKVLLILPKRQGKADELRPGRLAYDEMVPPNEVAPVLGLVDSAATFGRYESISSWRADPRFHDPPVLRNPQLVQSNRLTPLISASEGILIGEIRSGDRRLVLVSDPDLFANHSLGTGRNAAIVYGLVQDALGGQGKLIFEEAIHGFSVAPGHTGRILFEWPFVLVTVQIVAAATLLIWASAARFGAPAKLPPPLGTGKASLIESGSRMLVSSGHVQFVAGRYIEAIARDAAVRVHAPRVADIAALKEWFGRTGHPFPPAALAVNNSRTAIAAAKEMFVWRRKILDESRLSAKHR